MDRSEDTSELTAAPPVRDTGLEPGIAGNTGEVLEIMPPRPLPPIAFRVLPVPSPDMAPPAPMPARVFLRSGPAFEPVHGPPPERVPAPSEPMRELSPIDVVLSEIDAEAAARSLTAIEGRVPEAIHNLDGLQSQASSASVAAAPNLGSLIPGAPRLEMPLPRREPAFAGLQADLAVRPNLTELRTNLPAPDDAGSRSLVRRALRVVAWIAAAWLAVVLLLMVAYRFVNPPASMLMLQQWVFGQKIVNTWVPIERMSPNIVRAVIASEDGRFCEHNGVDFEALKGAVADAGNGGTRGASTISMQVVKNLFLWSSRSYVRKAVEMPLTLVMEMLWPKRRIMEVYLNIAEWGPGIFGIEAASQFRFHKPASSLSAGEASRLAVALPNPRVRNPAKPGPGMQRLARVVQMRMRLAPAGRTTCVLPRRRN